MTTISKASVPTGRQASAKAELTKQLLLLNARELVRDRRYFIFAFVFPFGMLAVFLALGQIVPSGNGAPDFTQMVVPMALFLAVTSSALTTTAGPLAGMRDKGTVRLLGTTPVGRARFVLTHMAMRIVMVICQLVLVLLIAVLIGAVNVATAPLLLAISLPGVVMFLAIGYLIGGRLRSADAANNVATLVQLSALFLSGLAFPLSLMPRTLASVLSYLPTSFFANLLTMAMPTGVAMHSAVLSILVVVVTAAVFIALAIRTFSWDEGDDN